MFHYGDGETLFDFITADTLVSNASTRPLHDLALCSEATRIGQMLYVIRQSKALPYEVKTDSCLYRPQKRRKVELASLRYCDSTSCGISTNPRIGCYAWTSDAL